LTTYTAVAGVAGLAGNGISATTDNVGLTALSTALVTGGAGGGNVSQSFFPGGGTIYPASVILTSAVSGGISGNGISPSNGSNGYFSIKPFASTGGAGGSGAIATGGSGGNGGYGSGGGGGSAIRTNSITGYFGGKGGDGLIIITTIM
jgi:hypothetical protein